MEAIEVYHAEECDLPALTASPAEMSNFSELSVPMAELPWLRHQHPQPNRPIQWYRGQQLATGTPRWVPADFVHLRQYQLARGDYLSPLHRSSNGLASGNVFPEAVLAGLFEVIERDAFALWRAAGLSWDTAARYLDLAALETPLLKNLVQQCQDAGVGLLIADITGDTQVPTFVARLVDLHDSELGSAVGYGCHRDTEIALIRAITEAAQGRAVIQVAGSRDDVNAFERAVMRGNPAARQRFEQLAGQATFEPKWQQASADVAQDLDWTLHRLAAVGLGDAIAVELTKPEFPISVVKVVLPGAESMCTLPGYRMGKRARRHTRG